MGGSAAKGFFYNTNHTAAFFYALLPFSAALWSLPTSAPLQRDRHPPTQARRSNVPSRRGRDVRAPGGLLRSLPTLGDRRRDRRFVGGRHTGPWRGFQHASYGSLLRTFLCLISLPLLWLGVVMTGSRLGLLLTVVASIAALLDILTGSHQSSKARQGAALGGSIRGVNLSSSDPIRPRRHRSPLSEREPFYRSQVANRSNDMGRRAAIFPVRLRHWIVRARVPDVRAPARNHQRAHQQRP